MKGWVGLVGWPTATYLHGTVYYRTVLIRRHWMLIRLDINWLTCECERIRGHCVLWRCAIEIDIYLLTYFWYSELTYKLCGFVTLVWTFCSSVKSVAACSCMHTELFILAQLNFLSLEFTMYVRFRYFVAVSHTSWYCCYCLEQYSV